jgi:hypothetical protein
METNQLETGPRAGDAPLGRARHERRAMSCLIVVALVCAALVSVFRGFSSSPTSASGAQATTASRFVDLEALMSAGVNEHATVLSFRIFHEGDMDDAGRQEVVSAADALGVLCEEMRSVTTPHWKVDQRAFFERQRAGLAESAKELGLAARRSDRGGMNRIMGEIERSCTECHSRLAPHLVRKEHP